MPDASDHDAPKRLSTMGEIRTYEVLSAASRHQDPRSFLAPLGLADFWNLHDSRTLLLNAAYPIVK